MKKKEVSNNILGVNIQIKDISCGINKEVYKQIEVLKTDIAELKNKVVNN